MKYQHVTTNPTICGGVPIFKGTRIPIYIILDLLSAGEDINNILENYPQLKKEHILESIKYVSALSEYREELIEISN